MFLLRQLRVLIRIIKNNEDFLMNKKTTCFWGSRFFFSELVLPGIWLKIRKRKRMLLTKTSVGS